MTTAGRAPRRQTGAAAGAGADPVLAPRSIALIGASERTYFARNIFRNLWEHRYRGAIHLVNARRSTEARNSDISCRVAILGCELSWCIAPGRRPACARRSG